MLVKERKDNYWALNWLDQFMIGHKGFICGGCFKNIFNKEKVKDLDIFFKSKSDFEEAVSYYNSNEEYKFSYENANVKAYVHKKTDVRIELCCKIFGKAEDILNQFDFTITKFAYYKEEVEDETGAEFVSPFDNETIEVPLKSTHIEYKVLIHDKFFEHLHMKRLVTDDKILFPMSTFERIIRYAKYGYFPCKETKMKIAREINNLSKEQLEVSEVLYDGMD